MPPYLKAEEKAEQTFLKVDTIWTFVTFQRQKKKKRLNLNLSKLVLVMKHFSQIPEITFVHSPNTCSSSCNEKMTSHDDVFK